MKIVKESLKDKLSGPSNEEVEKKLKDPDFLKKYFERGFLVDEDELNIEVNWPKIKIEGIYERDFNWGWNPDMDLYSGHIDINFEFEVYLNIDKSLAKIIIIDAENPDTGETYDFKCTKTYRGELGKFDVYSEYSLDDISDTISNLIFDCAEIFKKEYLSHIIY